MELDARGLNCPEPVIRTKTAVEKEKPAAVSVVVDNLASQENVQRFLESQGFNTSLSNKGQDFFVFGDREKIPETIPSAVKEEGEEAPEKILVLCSTDRMGYGDDDLGKKLMISFIKTVNEMGKDLWKLVLVNNGVKLAIEGSDVLADIQALEKDGVSIMVCGTCLTHFDLMEEKRVGETTNMLDIVTAMHLAGKVIKM
jgi:selenium metabolism protein YedF